MKAINRSRSRLGVGIVCVTFIGAAGGVAIASPAVSPVHIDPTSGPPGTSVMVSVSGGYCDAGSATVDWSPDTIEGQTLLEEPFTPPSKVVTVPALPIGDYVISVRCDGQEQGYGFFVTSTSSPPQPIATSPSLAG